MIDKHIDPNIQKLFNRITLGLLCVIIPLGMATAYDHLIYYPSLQEESQLKHKGGLHPTLNKEGIYL